MTRQELRRQVDELLINALVRLSQSDARPEDTPAMREFRETAQRVRRQVEARVERKTRRPAVRDERVG
jgi:hypothetical protein